MIIPIYYGKIKAMFQTTNQPLVNAKVTEKIIYPAHSRIQPIEVGVLENFAEQFLSLSGSSFQ